MESLSFLDRILLKRINPRNQNKMRPFHRAFSLLINSLHLEETFMAFDFIPQTSKEILDSKKPDAPIVAKVFDYVFDKYASSVSLDPTGTRYKTIKIPRRVEKSGATISTIKTDLKRLGVDVDKEKVTIVFGDGSGKYATTRNALGAKLTVPGELATIEAIKHGITKPADTKQQLFIDDNAAFQDWKTTFEETPKTVRTFLKEDVSRYDIIHLGSMTSPLVDVVNSFVQKIGMKRDSWNPADIYFIKKNSESAATARLKSIMTKYAGDPALQDIFNVEFHKLYEEGILYPVSLKQIVRTPGHVEYSNIPGAGAAEEFDIRISQFTLNMTSGKEIGMMTFLNADTSKNISMQVRGFPHGYSIAQTEVSGDGSGAGGRVGKVSVKVIDRVLASYNDKRITEMSYFGLKPAYFSKFDDTRINEVWGWYQKVSSHSRVNVKGGVTKAEFKKMVADAKKDQTLAENLAIKIQGLKIMNFLISNEKDVSTIMNRIISGAKKTENGSGFFIKVY